MTWVFIIALSAIIHIDPVSQFTNDAPDRAPPCDGCAAGPFPVQAPAPDTAFQLIVPSIPRPVPAPAPRPAPPLTQLPAPAPAPAPTPAPAPAPAGGHAPAPAPAPPAFGMSYEQCDRLLQAYMSLPRQDRLELAELAIECIASAVDGDW